MLHTLELARRATRLRTFAVISGILAIFVGACNNADNLAPEPTATISFDSSTTDSLGTLDSLALADSLELTDSLSLTDVDLDVSFASTAAARRRGTPFGPDGLWASYTQMRKGHQLFTASINSDAPAGIIKRINAARASRHQLVLMMTGGGHKNYITRGRFSYAKWKARMDRYRTPWIRAAVAAGVKDGTVLMNNMLDEPNHPDWGGAINKAMLDRMARYVKSIFPTLPVGVSIRWDWRPNERYRAVDFIQTQYVTRFGSVTKWREQALAAARKNGIKLVFAFNPLNGGTRIKGCPLGRTGGKGTYGGNCRMTPSQIRATAAALGPSGCALLMWRYDARFMSKAANIRAFKDAAARLASNSRKSCRRS
jgi:hypothetical protein